MSDGNTALKDLSEMQRLVIGSAVNFLYNVINNQIYHIENHNQELLDFLRCNEKAQEEYILLQNFREIASDMTMLMGETLSSLSDEEKEDLSIPGIKLEMFLQSVFNLIGCGSNDDEEI